MSSLRTRVFISLAAVARACGDGYGLSSPRAHDDSLSVAVRVLISVYLLLGAPSRLVGVLSGNINRGRSAVQFAAAPCNSFCVHVQDHHIREYIAGDSHSLALPPLACMPVVNSAMVIPPNSFSCQYVYLHDFPHMFHCMINSIR